MLHKKTELTNSVVRDFALGFEYAYVEIFAHYEVKIHLIGRTLFWWDAHRLHHFKVSIFRKVVENKECFSSKASLDRFIYRIVDELIHIYLTMTIDRFPERPVISPMELGEFGNETKFEKQFGSKIWARVLN
jgi:hypothetical protein